MQPAGTLLPRSSLSPHLTTSPSVHASALAYSRAARPSPTVPQMSSSCHWLPQLSSLAEPKYLDESTLFARRTAEAWANTYKSISDVSPHVTQTFCPPQRFLDQPYSLTTTGWCCARIARFAPDLGAPRQRRSGRAGSTGGVKLNRIPCPSLAFHDFIACKRASEDAQPLCWAMDHFNMVKKELSHSRQNHGPWRLSAAGVNG